MGKNWVAPARASRRTARFIFFISAFYPATARVCVASLDLSMSTILFHCETRDKHQGTCRKIFGVSPWLLMVSDSPKVTTIESHKAGSGENHSLGKKPIESPRKAGSPKATEPM